MPGLNPGFEYLHVLQGVTHVSKMVQYPGDPSDDTPPTWVAHFAHPLEVEWVATQTPPPGKWPMLLLQVCSYDPWDRATTEGYGWLQLGQGCPGSTTQVISTWKPLGEGQLTQRSSAASKERSSSSNSHFVCNYPCTEIH